MRPRRTALYCYYLFIYYCIIIIGHWNQGIIYYSIITYIYVFIYTLDEAYYEGKIILREVSITWSGVSHLGPAFDPPNTLHEKAR